MRSQIQSRHILENPHAIVGMRIYSKSRRWDYTIEKVTEPYFYPYAVCLDHKDKPDLWAVCYNQRDALNGERRSLALCDEYCAYCIAEFIAFEHVVVPQHNGYGNWAGVTPFRPFEKECQRGEFMCEVRRKGLINLATDAVFELGYPDEKAARIATHLVDNGVVSESSEYTSHVHKDIENHYGEDVLWGDLEKVLT